MTQPGYGAKSRMIRRSRPGPARGPVLIAAGAPTQDVTLSPDDPKPPSHEVADLLRGYGIGGAQG